MSAFKLGRLPRLRSPRVPHLSALLAGKSLPAPLPSVDWTVSMPSDLGSMLNTVLGCCTCSAWGHAVQCWTANTGKMQTLTDSAIESLYEHSCGYVPGDPATDQGGIEQLVLRYLATTGLEGNKLASFVEVDPRNQDDIRRTIEWACVAYLGATIPQYILDRCTDAGSTWDLPKPGDNTTPAGGHAFIVAAYDSQGLRANSWGRWYTITWPFLARQVEEAYLLVDQDWQTAKGVTPAGMTLAQLTAQADAIREAA